MKDLTNDIKHILGDRANEATPDKVSQAMNIVEYMEGLHDTDVIELSNVQKLQCVYNNLNELASKRKRGAKWTFNAYNSTLFTDLFYYFIRSPESSLDLDRDLFLIGNFGIGKTSMLTAFLKTPFEKTPLEKYHFEGLNKISTIELVNKYNNYLFEKKDEEKGTDFLGKYQRDDWFFDDLGREKKPHFSTKGDPQLMTGIIESRYNSKERLRTHYTTNKSMEQIAEVYTYRVESIIHETCNIIQVGGEDYRKKI